MTPQDHKQVIDHYAITYARYEYRLMQMIAVAVYTGDKVAARKALRKWQDDFESYTYWIGGILSRLAAVIERITV